MTHAQLMQIAKQIAFDNIMLYGHEDGEEIIRITLEGPTKLDGAHVAVQAALTALKRGIALNVNNHLKVPEGYKFPYSQTFFAIGQATKIENSLGNKTLNISVENFQTAFHMRTLKEHLDTFGEEDPM